MWKWFPWENQAKHELCAKTLWFLMFCDYKPPLSPRCWGSNLGTHTPGRNAELHPQPLRLGAEEMVAFLEDLSWFLALRSGCSQAPVPLASRNLMHSSGFCSPHTQNLIFQKVSFVDKELHWPGKDHACELSTQEV